MKMGKKILALLMAVLLSVNMLQTVAYAAKTETGDFGEDEATIPALTLDVPVTAEIEGEVQYTFTPDESGYYAFWVYSSGSFSEGWMDNAEYGRWYGDYHVVYSYLHAKETYYCGVSSRSSTGAGVITELGISKAVEVTEPWLDETEVTTYVGEPEWIYLNFEPMLGYPGDITWTSSDERVLSIAWSDAYICEVNALSVGTATVTATLPNGTSTSCKVTVEDGEDVENVIEYPALTLDVPVTASIEDGWTFTFTPNESGYYAYWVYNPCGYSADGWISSGMTADSVASRRNGNYHVSYAYLNAGQTYICYTMTYGRLPSFAEFGVSKATEATDLSLDKIDITLYEDGCTYIALVFESMLEYPGDVSWSVSDESILELDLVDYDKTECFIRALSAGTATVMATLPNGMTASCDVTVKTPPVLSLDEPVSEIITDQIICRYMPEESGYYAFWVHSPDGCAYVSPRFDWDYNEGWPGEYHIVYTYLNAGETYSYSVYHTEDTAVATEFGINRVVEPTDFWLDETEITMYEGQYAWIDLGFDPIGGYTDDIAWSVSDASIVVLPYTSNYACEFYARSAGTATVTATLKNGATASCKVTVLEPVTTETVLEAIQSTEDGVLRLSTGESSIHIDMEATQAIQEAGAVNQLVFELNNGLTTAVLDEALTDMLLQVEDYQSITLYIEEILTADLNKNQRAVLKGKDVAVALSTKLSDAYGLISDFHGGTIEIKMPFVLGAGERAADYHLYHIAGDGEMTEVEFEYDDAGFMVFTLEHFSEYVILREKSHISGDINGDGRVNNKDATRLFQYLSDWDVEVVEAALDVNGDGRVNNKDATRLFQFLSDWDVEIF